MLGFCVSPFSRHCFSILSCAYFTLSYTRGNILILNFLWENIPGKHTGSMSQNEN